MINNCIKCKTKLIPVVHKRIDHDVLDMYEKGLLIISSDKNVNSYCPLCEEAYGDYTDYPAIPQN